MNKAMELSIRRRFLSLNTENIKKEISSTESVIKRLEKKSSFSKHEKTLIFYFKDKLILLNDIYVEKTIADIYKKIIK